MNWNGRIGELLKVAFGSYLSTTIWFAFINAFIGVSVIYLFFAMLFLRFPKANIQDFGFLSLIVFVIMQRASFGAIFYWAAGSLNYLWAYCLILLFLLPYRLFFGDFDSTSTQNPESKFTHSRLHTSSTLFTLIMFMLGICAGWGSELNAVLIVVLCSGVVYAFCTKKKLPLWYIAGLVGFVCGWIILYSSPGSAKRMALMIEMGWAYSLHDLWEMSFYEKLALLQNRFGRMDRWISNIVAFTFAVWILKKYASLKTLIKVIIIAMMIIVFFVLRKHCNGGLFFGLIATLCLFGGYSLDSSRESKLCYGIGGLLVIYSLYSLVTLQIALPERAKLHFTLLLIAMLAIVWWYVKPYLGRFDLYLRMAMMCLCVGYGAFVISACMDMSFKWHKMLGFIDGSKQAGQSHIVIDKNTFHSYYSHYSDWGNPSENPNEWPNNVYARVFGVESFVAK